MNETILRSIRRNMRDDPHSLVEELSIKYVLSVGTIQNIVHDHLLMKKKCLQNDYPVCRLTIKNNRGLNVILNCSIYLIPTDPNGVQTLSKEIKLG